MKEKPLVSIIIPTKNSEGTLFNCLDSIKNQTYKNIEVVIVDKFSKGSVVERANGYGAKVIAGPYNKPAARNIGIMNSSGDILLFADADFIFENTLIEEIVNIFQHEPCDAIFVPEEYLGHGFLGDCRTLEKRCYQEVSAIEAPRVYKRWVCSKLLFDEANEGPDEYDFYLNALSLCIKTSSAKSKVLLMEHPVNFRKKFRHGKFYEYYMKKHEGKDIIRKQVNLSFRLNLICRAFPISPVKASGLFILKSIEYFSFNLGRFAGYFDRRIQRLTINTSEEFNEVGGCYETGMYHGSLGNEHVDRVEKETVLQILKRYFKGRRIKVLDVGAGNGRWSREFLSQGHTVTALDISENMCDYLRKNSGDLKVVRGDIECIGLNGNFDLVFSFRNFKYVRNIEQALLNMRRLLKECEYIVIEIPNKNNPFYLLPYMLSPVLYALTDGKVGKYFVLINMISGEEFTEKLKQTGFTMIKKERLLFFPHKVYSMINSKYILKFVGLIDRNISHFIPRSYIFISKKEGDVL